MNQINFFFLINQIDLNMEKETNQESTIIISNSKHEKFSEKPLIYLLFLKLEVKKVKTFIKQLKNLKSMQTTNFIIH